MKSPLILSGRRASARGAAVFHPRLRHCTNAPTVKYGLLVSFMSRNPNTPPVNTNLPVAGPDAASACTVVTTPGTFCV